MTEAHFTTWGHEFAVGKLDVTKPLKLQTHKNLRSKSTVAAESHKVHTVLDGAVAMTVFSGRGGVRGLAVVLCCWQACDSPAIEDKSAGRTGLIHRWPSLQERTTGQHNRTDRTHRHQRRRTPSSSRALSFITAATDATSPLHLPLSYPLSLFLCFSLSLSPRDLYLSALLHISSISVPPSQQCTAVPDELRYLI